MHHHSFWNYRSLHSLKGTILYTFFEETPPFEDPEPPENEEERLRDQKIMTSLTIKLQNYLGGVKFDKSDVLVMHLEALSDDKLIIFINYLRQQARYETVTYLKDDSEGDRMARVKNALLERRRAMLCSIFSNNLRYLLNAEIEKR